MSLVCASTPAWSDPQPRQGNPPGTLSQDYVDRVNDALRSNRDEWGDALLARPNGPTLEAMRPLLQPANNIGSLTESGFHYLPLTYPRPVAGTWQAKRAFSLHVADGSTLLTNWARDRSPQSVSFLVGQDGTEVYGSNQARLNTPALADGFLPVLENTYTDGTGAKVERTSFVHRVGGDDGPLVSHVKLTVTPQKGKATKVALGLDTAGVNDVEAEDGRLTRDGKTYAAFSPGGGWDSPRLTYRVAAGKQQSFYFVVANQPSDLGGVKADAAGFDAALAKVSAYWKKTLTEGAEVKVPETYANDALKNMVLQNLVMSYQQSIGNGYESTDSVFAFVPEVALSIRALGLTGQFTAYRESLQELLRRGQGPEYFPNWEMGIKLQEAANYQLLTGDRSFLDANLPLFTGYLDDFTAQRAKDPNGLLAKQRYGTDVDGLIYGLHHQAQGWRGMRDFGIALRQIGQTELADRVAAESASFHAALTKAIRASQHKLSDGTLFVPMSLLDPNAEKPYDSLTRSWDGSYWNITIPFILSTGIFAPGSPEAKGIRDYVLKHGGRFLGLTRFNLSTIDPGTCYSGSVGAFPLNAPGYKSSGFDEQYGFGWSKFLSDNHDRDLLALQFYGKLAHDLTPGTFIGGEGATIAPCPEMGEYYRSQFFPPLSANNATYVQTMRSLLVTEDNGPDGTPKRLNVMPSAPREWLLNGKTTSVERLPSMFGPVSFSVTSNLAQGNVTATVTPPPAQSGRPAATDVVLALRPPAGHKLVSATVNGASAKVDAAKSTVNLGALRSTATVRAEYQAVPVEDPDQARPTALSVDRKLFRPGETVSLSGSVEALGSATVRGKVSVTAPNGWTVEKALTDFAVPSDGVIRGQAFTTALTVPASTSPGDYDITVTTTPSSGKPRSHKLPIRVAVPSTKDYATLVKDAKPITYWRMDDTGVNVSDVSPNNVNGLYQGGALRGEPGAIAGDQNTSARLIGGFVEVPNARPFSSVAAYTHEAWIKVTAAVPQSLIEKYDAPGHRGFVLRLGAGNKLYAEILGAPGQPITEVTGTTTVTPGEWHHVAVTFNGSKLAVHLDGRVDAEVKATAPPVAGDSSLKIGARGDDLNQRLSGWVDEVALYDRELSQREIDSHYVKGKLGNP
ncbi:LamG-like jellyroll fold domain-containing protein [Allokutzneria sp. NRRL B-24872]|uniref:LamG-like jellyroll fold domain-containing protein n=1 Tax=Allokutzneria sp. NRRL B-24872 TaxID=1137961 RepID=UPI00143D17AD|nr:LamG-like jellyroll fold domain-containing protein [Allokutzneria sp. NRRL B-24872]